MIRPTAKVSEQVNRKWPPRNTTVQLSAWALILPTAKISNAVQRTLCSHDAHADHEILLYILFLANQNVQPSTIGYLSNSLLGYLFQLVLSFWGPDLTWGHCGEIVQLIKSCSSSGDGRSIENNVWTKFLQKSPILWALTPTQSSAILEDLFLCRL